ncbi:hypothetical protein [Actinomyces culturomici]|uniref:hypothetical protein n=1 Tax=Actinomyces culturomici TaxID=1926276 RepID=UPI000E2064F0|nr:hypothetical protein [Actinomyces culturomici]
MTDPRYSGWNSVPEETPGWNPPGNGPAPESPSPYEYPAPASSPGIIPFRPLAIGDLFEGAFKAFRKNPVVLLGMTAVLMSIVGVFTGINSYSALRTTESFSRFDPNSPMGGRAALEAILGPFTAMAGSSALLSVLTFVVSILLTGALSIAVADAVIGRAPGFREVLARTGPRILPLVGVSILSGIVYSLVVIAAFVAGGALVAALLIPARNDSEPSPGAVVAVVLLVLLLILIVFVAVVAIETKLVFAPIVCVLEELGPVESLKRSWRLTKGVFWRTLGRILLIGLVTGAVAGLVSGTAGGVAAASALSGSLAGVEAVAIGVSTLLAGLVLPVTIAYEVLMYTDERIRREGFAPMLAAAARGA